MAKMAPMILPEVPRAAAPPAKTEGPLEVGGGGTALEPVGPDPDPDPAGAVELLPGEEPPVAVEEGPLGVEDFAVVVLSPVVEEPPLEELPLADEPPPEVLEVLEVLDVPVPVLVVVVVVVVDVPVDCGVDDGVGAGDAVEVSVDEAGEVAVALALVAVAADETQEQTASAEDCTARA